MGLSKVPSAGLAPSANILTWLALTNSGSAAPWVKLCTISGSQNDRGSIVLSGSASYSANDDAIAGGATINFTVGNDASVNNLNLQVINSSNQNTLVLAAYVVKGATDFIWDLWIKTQEFARINAFAFGNVYTITATYTDITTTTKPTGGYDKRVGRDVSSLTPGTVLQVIQSVVTYPISFSLGSLADAISVAITPSSASSKILVQWDTTWGRGADDYGAFYLYRNGSKVYGATGDASYQDYQRAAGAIMNRGAGQDQYMTQAISGKYLDSPASTSAQTYTIKAYCSYGSYIYLNRAEFVGDTGYQLRTFSTLTAMEIAG